MTETDLQLWDACLETGLCDEHALERARTDRAAAIGRGERVDLLTALAATGALSETQAGILRRAIDGRESSWGPATPARRPVPRHRPSFPGEAADQSRVSGGPTVSPAPPARPRRTTEGAVRVSMPKPAGAAPLPLDASLPAPEPTRRVSAGGILVGVLSVAAIAAAAAGAIFVLPGLLVRAEPRIAEAPPPRAAPAETTEHPAVAALAAAVAHAEQHPEQFAEATARLDALAAAHEERLGDALAAARARVDEIRAEHLEARLGLVVAKAERLRSAGDPLGAALALLAFPTELRAGASGEKWSEAFGAALEQVRKATGMALVPGGVVPGEGLPDGAPSPDEPVATFLIDLTEVSNSSYAEFVAETGARAPAHWRHGRPTTMLTSRPVVGITAEEAAAYAEWAGKRLPTAAEWRLAAAGPEGWPYPWGETLDPARLRAALAEAAAPQSLAPTRTHADGRAMCGAYHMAGNAAEWVAGRITADDGRPAHVALGGSARDEQPGTRTRHVWPADTNDPALLIGFRCAKDVR